MIVAVLHIVSIPLGAASASVLAPSSQLAGIQALPGLSFTYGSFVGTLIALELFGILAFASLYFVLKETSPFSALAAVLLILIGIGVVLAGGFPMRYVQINVANDFASASSDAQRSGFAATYQLAFDIGNIGSLIELVMDAAAFSFIGYAMRRDKVLFGRPISYLALLSSVLLALTFLVSWIPTAFAVMFVVVSLVAAAFDALTGRRLYRMP